MTARRVRYTGLADERRIHPRDVADHGVKLEKELVWNRGNRFAVDLELTDEFEAILRETGGFRIEELTDDGSTRVQEGDKEMVVQTVASPLTDSADANTKPDPNSEPATPTNPNPSSAGQPAGKSGKG